MQLHRNSFLVRTTARGLVVFAILVGSLILAGCSNNDDATSVTTTTSVVAKPPASESGTIVDYVAADATLSTLASIVGASDLAKTLAGPGPFTLFAPTNEAFAALPAAGLAALRTATPHAKALDVHLVASKLAASDLIPLNGTKIETLGGPVPVTIDGRTLRIGNASVTRTDVFASNGVIHFIDAVITTKAG